MLPSLALATFLRSMVPQSLEVGTGVVFLSHVCSPVPGPRLSLKEKLVNESHQHSSPVVTPLNPWPHFLLAWPHSSDPRSPFCAVSGQRDHRPTQAGEEKIVVSNLLDHVTEAQMRVRKLKSLSPLPARPLGGSKV
jgi:hypothetical protein